MATGSNQRNGGAQSAHSGRNTQGGRRGTQKKGGKAIVFVIELVVITLLIGVLVVTVKAFGGNEDGQEKGNFISKLFNNIGDAFSGTEGKDAKGISFVKLEEEQLKIAEEVKQNEVMKGYMNVALFGVDISKEKTDESGQTVLLPAGSLRRSGLLKGFRSDTMMIASVNLDTGDIKLVSIYRDTFLNIGDTYSKCNAAYAKGGAEQAVKMMNTNLDMDMENFVTVSYWALVGVIDALGGVDIDVTEKELSHLNNYGISIGKTMNEKASSNIST